MNISRWILSFKLQQTLLAIKIASSLSKYPSASSCPTPTQWPGGLGRVREGGWPCGQEAEASGEDPCPGPPPCILLPSCSRGPRARALSLGAAPHSGSARRHLAHSPFSRFRGPRCLGSSVPFVLMFWFGLEISGSLCSCSLSCTCLPPPPALKDNRAGTQKALEDKGRFRSRL